MKRCVPFLVLVLTAGCGGGANTSAPQTAPRAPAPANDAAPWPAPADPMKLTVRAGLTPETNEFVFLHVHAHLDVFVNGEPVPIPAGIGIEIHDPSVKSFKAKDGSMGYGGISPPCSTPCISPLHTHFVDGVLHTEAKEDKFNTLGEFFTEWDVRLDRKCVGGYCKPATVITIYVNGDPYSSDPREISLEDKTEIAVVIGSPPKNIPSSGASG
ncbi:MAG: hypothetical protein H0W90_03355 [Actinobacteria bacterium]|nr:hypothetical protein [Actinomycetota bacterium]